MSWIEQQAKNKDPKADRVTLEHPTAVRALDRVLEHTYFPRIREALVKCGYPFHPTGDQGVAGAGDLHIQTSWLGPDLARRLVFMLFDDGMRPIMRGSLDLARHGYLFEREFFLALPRTTDPELLFAILSDQDFAGQPPTLSIEPATIYPEWNAYYWIELRRGEGLQSGDWTFHQPAIGTIEATILTSVEMYEASIEGFAQKADVNRFLTLARRCYAAS